MTKFRIIQTQPLTSVLPYEVEESHRLWFLPLTVWRPIKECKYVGRRSRIAPRRFQTPQEAQAFTEQMLALRASQAAEQARVLDERRQQRQLPRVVQVLDPAMPA